MLQRDGYTVYAPPNPLQGLTTDTAALTDFLQIISGPTDLAYIGYLSARVNPAGARFEVAVIHHTDCGTHFLADADFRRGFAGLIGGDDTTLAAEAVVHPEQTVRLDVELLRSSAILPATITVSGHVYDVSTGLITTIVPAASMHTSSS